MAHEFDGEKYEKASAHQREWGAKLIVELGLKGTERVLDLGCGDGALSAQLAETVPTGKVVGIDSSQGMISAARQRQRGNLSFRHFPPNQRVRAEMKKAEPLLRRLSSSSAFHQRYSVAHFWSLALPRAEQLSLADIRE